MSPEQAATSRALVDHRTDIYSLGLTLYELITLKYAFPGDDRRLLLQQISNEEPPRPSKLNRGLPADLETIVLKAMAKDPNQRYESARRLAEDLKRFLAGRPILAKRPALSPEPSSGAAVTSSSSEQLQRSWWRSFLWGR
jgi:serine/threonine protein kinase